MMMHLKYPMPPVPARGAPNYWEKESGKPTAVFIQKRPPDGPIRFLPGKIIALSTP
jgi:hypothetical protein